jgi:hypothetical protein
VRRVEDRPSPAEMTERRRVEDRPSPAEMTERRGGSSRRHLASGTSGTGLAPRTGPVMTSFLVAGPTAGSS